MSEDNRSIGGLPKLATDYFDPDKDCFLLQKDSNKKLYRVPFNILIESVHPNHDDRIFQWNETQDIALFKKNIRLNENGYDYFDCKVADIDNPGTLRDIPEESKYILLKINQSGLEISGPPGWEALETGQTVFLFENMQYPIYRFVSIYDSEYIPNGLNHKNMTPVNHAAFRCPAGTINNQYIWATAWSY